MNFLPQASGNRPRLACEIMPQGVVAARAETAAAPLTAVARVSLAAGAVTPGLKPGNVVDRVAVAAAVRKALEDVGGRPGSRDSDVTVVLPDAAVRVLLLDFDALPNKLSEALPIVRFRLKKMLPFDADDAMVSFQIMSTSKQMVRVLAVAIPPDVLAEYESVVREAGFEPGSVLPSTLAAVAAMDDAEGAALLINANPAGITTAIVRNGILLLHRSVDLQRAVAAVPANYPPAMFEDHAHKLPLVNEQDSVAEWAAQEPLPEHGREVQSAILVAPETMREFAEDVIRDRALAVGGTAPVDDLASDIAQAVSVAVAYYEDTLEAAPERVWCAGPMGADALQRILNGQGLTQVEGLRAREVVSADAVLSSTVPRGWLAGVLGALRG